MASLYDSLLVPTVGPKHKAVSFNKKVLCFFYFSMKTYVVEKKDQKGLNVTFL